MAQGDFTLFEEFALNLGNGDHNMGSDNFSVILITTLPTAADASPDRADYTECSAGGSYSTGGIALTESWTEAAGVGTFDFTNDPEWAAAASSPTNIKAALIVNDTHASTRDAVGFIDMTTDAGTTAISMVDGKVKIVANPSGVFTLTIN
jgi:hypothetical protein